MNRLRQGATPDEDPRSQSPSDERSSSNKAAPQQVLPAAVDEEKALAARSALARAQQAAIERGFRPGSRPLARRTRVTPAGANRGRRAGRDPQPLGENMEKFLEERGWNVDLAAGIVMGRWVELVGPQVADHAKPVTFENGVLTVRAESTAWTTQLGLLQSSIIGTLEAEVGPGVVQELKIVGPAAPSWARGPRRVKGRGPRDTYG